MDAGEEGYDFIGVGVANNVGNIGDILQSAQHRAVNKIYYLIFNKLLDVVEDCLTDKNDDDIKHHKRQFITIMNNFVRDFDLEKNTFIIHNWLNPNDNKMYVMVVADKEKVLNFIVYLVDNEIKLAKAMAKYDDYIIFLQNIKTKVVAIKK